MNNEALWADITRLPPKSPKPAYAADASPMATPEPVSAALPDTPASAVPKPAGIDPASLTVPKSTPLSASPLRVAGPGLTTALTAPPLPAASQKVLSPTETKPNPLKRFSLQGHGEDVAKSAQVQHPLLGDLCLAGQATVWFAQPNTGKTLICLKLAIEAVGSGRIRGDDVYYVNVDDSSSGLLSKLSILEEYNVHVLAEGYKGFKAARLTSLMDEMIETDTARGQFIILDTLKKFVSVMDKKESSQFAHLIRRFVMAGGTVLCLAHTNKRPNADGKAIYAGTSDIVDDFDCSYIISTVMPEAAPGDRTIVFENNKRRGNVAQRAYYTYTIEDGVPYEEVLASVRLADPDRFEPAVASTGPSDAEIIEAVKTFLLHGTTTKMKLAEGVAKVMRISQRAAIKAIEKYTGDDPVKHHWTYEVHARGAKVFVLLTAALPGSGEVIVPT